MYGGDTIFAISTDKITADLSVVGLLAARGMERVVVSAEPNATSASGIRCYRDMLERVVWNEN